MSFPSYHRYVGTNQQVFDGILDFVKAFKLQHDIGVEKLKEFEKQRDKLHKDLIYRFNSHNVDDVKAYREKYYLNEKEMNDLFALLYVDNNTKLYLDLYDIFCSSE
jgi:hypothetical protein